MFGYQVADKYIQLRGVLCEQDERKSVMAQFGQLLHIGRNCFCSCANGIGPVRFIYNQHRPGGQDFVQRCTLDFFFRDFVGIKLGGIQAVNMAKIKRTVYYRAIFNSLFEQTVFVGQNHVYRPAGFAGAHIAGNQVNHDSAPFYLGMTNVSLLSARMEIANANAPNR